MYLASLARQALSRRYTSTQATSKPRPFPSSINVGIDIASIARFARIIRQQNSRNDSSESCADLNFFKEDLGRRPFLRSFLRKVFNCYEWRYLEGPLRSCLVDSKDPGKVEQLARLLASRWALKEAAIKAHSYRRLHYQDVIIDFQSGHGYKSPSSTTHGGHRQVLINPPRRMVRMTRTVASSRGVLLPAVEKDLSDLPKPIRSMKVSPEERQVARCSISHDGGYAVAIVYALDEPVVDALEDIIDDGTGDPIHEPMIGDRGFESIYLPSGAQSPLSEAPA